MQRARRAFSIIELLVVIAIVAILLAIILPAIAGVRRAARGSDTQTLLTEIAQAAARYELDKRVAPGYFTARDMGSPDNADRGFSAMQNIMLSLAGGVVDGAGAGTIEVGPLNRSEGRVRVAPARIGSAAVGAYYVPAPKFFVAQDQPGQRVPSSISTENDELPEVVDSWGTPVLAWQATGPSPYSIDTLDDFAANASGGPGADSVFYWASNAAFLGNGADGVGKLRKNQSVLSLLRVDGTNHLRTMAAVLGDPSNPLDETASRADMLPAAPRAGLVLHSAGADGVYLSTEDRGGRGAVNGALLYGAALKDEGNQRIRDAAGKGTFRDLTGDFDDLFLRGGR